MTTRQALMADWEKVSMDDIDTSRVCFNISRYTLYLVSKKADELGMSPTEFIEIALSGCNPSSSYFKRAKWRYDICNQERKYLRTLKQRFTRKNNKKSAEEQESSIRKVFDKIINEKVSGKELEELLKQEGLAFVESDNE